MESGFGPGRESNQELRNTPNSTTTGSPHTDLVATTNQPSHDRYLCPVCTCGVAKRTGCLACAGRHRPHVCGKREGEPKSLPAPTEPPPPSTTAAVAAATARAKATSPSQIAARESQMPEAASVISPDAIPAPLQEHELTQKPRSPQLAAALASAGCRTRLSWLPRSPQLAALSTVLRPLLQNPPLVAPWSTQLQPVPHLQLHPQPPPQLWIPYPAQRI